MNNARGLSKPDSSRKEKAEKRARADLNRRKPAPKAGTLSVLGDAPKTCPTNTSCEPGGIYQAHLAVSLDPRLWMLWVVILLVWASYCVICFFILEKWVRDTRIRSIIPLAYVQRTTRPRTPYSSLPSYPSSRARAGCRRTSRYRT